MASGCLAPAASSLRTVLSARCEQISGGHLTVRCGHVFGKDILNDLSQCGVEGGGDSGERIKARIGQSALNLAEIRYVYQRQIGKINLAQREAQSNRANAFTNDSRNIGVYIGHVPCSQAARVEHYSSWTAGVYASFWRHAQPKIISQMWMTFFCPGETCE